MAFATYRFYWGGKESDGATKQEHVDKAKQNAFAASLITDQTFADVPEEADCPYELQHIWEWFYELDSTRINGMSAGPITNVEITAWSDGMGYDLLPIERKALLAVDRAFQMHNSKPKEKT